MIDVVQRARRYLALNAAESGADVLIAEMADLIESLTLRADTADDYAVRAAQDNVGLRVLLKAAQAKLAELEAV